MKFIAKSVAGFWNPSIRIVWPVNSGIERSPLSLKKRYIFIIEMK